MSWHFPIRSVNVVETSNSAGLPPKGMGTITKVILAFLAIAATIVVGISAVAAMRPDEFRVKRQTTIAAPPSAIFPLVNDFHEWPKWSPWEKLDPDLKRTYEGPEAGKDASYSWVGNDQVGEGRMTILESRPDEAIKIKLEFIKPFASINTTEFTFKPEGDQTVVTWEMYGPSEFMFKVMDVLMNMDKTIGADFEKGLADMKTAAETKAEPKAKTMLGD